MIALTHKIVIPLFILSTAVTCFGLSHQRALDNTTYEVIERAYVTDATQQTSATCATGDTLVSSDCQAEVPGRFGDSSVTVFVTKEATENSSACRPRALKAGTVVRIETRIVCARRA